MPGPLIRTDLPLRMRYAQGGGIYRIIPAAVARPTTLAELTEILDRARQMGLTVTPRGAGSAMTGSNVSNGLILDCTLYEDDRCHIDVEADYQRAFTSPSITLARVNREGAPLGVRAGFDPSSSPWATIGGLVSTNAAGPHSVRFGSIRPWVRNIAMQTADGYLDLTRNREPDQEHPAIARWRTTAEPLIREHADTIRARFPKVRKNSAGYALDRYLETEDLIDLVIGSEGTLGVITDVGFDLVTVPAKRTAMRVAVRSRHDLVQVIETLRQFGPSTMELLDASFLRIIAGTSIPTERADLVRDAGGFLLVDFEETAGSNVDMLDQALDAARAVGPDALDVRIATDPADIAQLWEIRHRASPILAGLSDGRLSLQVIEDGCVPVARLGDYLELVDSAAKAERIDAVMFGHAGDGHVHVNLLPNLNDADWKGRVAKIYASVSAGLIAMGGTPSGEHGVGRLRAGLLEPLYGPEVMACFRAIKNAFDPMGVFNPGVILTDGSDPFTRLKVGADATVIPDAVAAYLQRIEADARWAESRWEG